MFVAWRDIRFACGRFALIAAVVALITLLVGFLSGLAGGLAAQNISAVLAMPGDRLVLEQPAEGALRFSDSSLSDATVDAWQQAPGVTAATPIGIAQGRATAADQPVAVALFGLPTGGEQTALTALAPAADDELGLSSGAAEQLGVEVGDSVTIGDTSYTVATIGGDLWYSHTPVVAMSPGAWSAAEIAVGGTGEPTILAVSGSPDWDALTASTQTSASTPLASLSAMDTFTSEVGSLALMIAMLFGVSALVVGAFFTVWTMQRSADIAVLKALGASNGSLVRDALGQALVVLAAGIATGLIVVVAVGSLAPAALPFLVSPLTTVAPAAVMALLGVLGSAFSLRNVTHADPLTALGSNR